MALNAKVLTLAAAALAAGLTTPLMAQQPAPPVAVPSAAPVDPAVAAAQKAYEALGETERKAIQDDLVWAGDYLGITQGVFGRRTYDGIVAFQKRGKAAAVDGILTPEQRKALETAARLARGAVKFTMLTDARTGIRLGVPELVAGKRDDKSGTGTRWFNDANSFSVETALAQGGAAELPQAFERVVAAAAPGRKVTYKLLRPDFFVVAGDIGARRFYTRFGAGPNGMRGYTVIYETARAKEFERINIAIANAFEPFPAAQPAVAAVSARPGVAALPAPLPVPAAPQPPPPPTERRGNAFVIADGQALTSASLLTACKTLTVGGQRAEIIGTDAAGAIALLKANVKRSGIIALRADGAEVGEPLVYVGFPAAAERKTVDVISGEAGQGPGLAIVAALQPGASGGLVFDRSGRLAGLAAAEPAQRIRIAGIAPEARHRLISAEAVKAFAAARGVDAGSAPEPFAQPLSAGEIVRLSRGAVLPVICGL